MGALISGQPPMAPVIDPAAPSLRANFQWTFAGNVIYAACQWGMLSVLAKADSPAVVGQLALALAIAAPIFMFTNLQLRAVQATDASSEFEFADYFTLRLLASFGGFLAIIVLAAFLHYDRATRLVVVLVGVSKMVESLSDVIAGFLQKHERLDQVAISLITRGILSLTAFGLVFLMTRDLVAAVLSLVLVWSLVLFFYDLTRVSALVSLGGNLFTSRSKELGRLLAVSAPLGLVMTLISLTQNIPRYSVAKYLGEGELGIFASMAYVLVTVNLVANALGQSATARLARMFAAGDTPGFKKTIMKLALFGLVTLGISTTLALLCGRALLTALYRPEYAREVAVFAIMMLTAGVGAIGSFFGYGMTAARSFRAQVPIIGMSTAVAAGLSFLLVPRMGLMGAAVALLLSAVAFTLGCAGALYKIVAAKPPAKENE